MSTINWAVFVIGVLACMGFFIVVQELLRRYQWLSWAVFLIIPVALIPWGIYYRDVSFFVWLKVYSIFISACWATAVRFTTLKNRKWPFIILYVLVILNILENTVQGLTTGQRVNYLNALTALLLVLTFPKPRSGYVTNETAYHDIYWDTPINWGIGYTIWGIVFINQFAPQFAGAHLSIFLAALLVGFTNHRLYLQSRVLTVSILFMLLFVAPQIFDVIRLPEGINGRVAMAVAISGLGWMLVHSLGSVKRFRHA